MQLTTLLNQKTLPPQGGKIYCEKLAKYDFVHLSPSTFLREIGDLDQSDLNAFCESWGNLEVDQHMADGGTYRKPGMARFRRHGQAGVSPENSTNHITKQQPSMA